VPAPPFTDQVRAVLRRPNPAVIATLRRDGSPVTVGTWYLLDGERVLVNMAAARTRLGHVRRDPRVSLTVFDGDRWWAHVSLQGRVTDIADDIGLASIDRISRHYTGHDFGDRENPRVDALIEVAQWFAWDLPTDESG
jgi:PPOX class probable F420-dependent enzyme